MQNVVIEHEFTVDFLDFEPEWKGFNQFPMETELDDYSFKAKQMVYMLNEVYQGECKLFCVNDLITIYG